MSRNAEKAEVPRHSPLIAEKSRNGKPGVTGRAHPRGLRRAAPRDRAADMTVY